MKLLFRLKDRILIAVSIGICIMTALFVLSVHYDTTPSQTDSLSTETIKVHYPEVIEPS